MGAAGSNLSQSLSTELSNNESSVCNTESVCQTAAVGSFVNDGTLDCENISVSDNTNKSSFSCTINQVAKSVANVVQKSNNMANAMWGDLSVSNSDVNAAVSISSNLFGKCGGGTPVVPNSAKNGGEPLQIPGGGVCQSGIVQKSTVKQIENGVTGSIKCTVMKMATNQANTSVNCTMRQFSSAQETVSQSVKNVSKGSTPFDSIVMIVLIVCIASVAAALIGGAGYIVHELTHINIGIKHAERNRLETAKMRLQRKTAELETMKKEVGIEQEISELRRMRQAAGSGAPRAGR